MRFKVYILLILISCIATSHLIAQNNYSLFGFNYTNLTYLSNATKATLSANENGVTELIPIGFTFNLNGQSYDNLKAYVNGLVTLGEGDYSTTGSDNNDINTNFEGIGATDIIAPLWLHLIFNASDNNKGIYYSTTGTAPNRVFTIEWNNVSLYGGSSSYNNENRYSFQLRIYESTNDVVINHQIEYSSGIANPITGIISKSKSYQILKNKYIYFAGIVPVLNSNYETSSYVMSESFQLSNVVTSITNQPNINNFAICNTSPSGQQLSFSLINIHGFDPINSIQWYKNTQPLSSYQNFNAFAAASTPVSSNGNDFTYTPTEMVPGEYYYYAKATSSGGSEFNTNVSGKFTFGNKFTLDIVGNYSNCDIVKLTASTGDINDNIIWSGGSFPNSFYNEFTNSGTYSVTVTRLAFNTCSTASTLSKTFNVVINTNVNGELIAIYNPDFRSQYQGGWQINRDAYFETINSSVNTDLVLTEDQGYQVGSAFWKRKIALNSNLSFSGYFEFKISPSNSRADGITFTVQQASNTAGTNGSGMGYLDLPNKSIAIEYDTYDNNSGNEGESNNHMALGINGEIHNSIQNRSYNYPFTTQDPYVIQLDRNVMDLADGKTKYNWVDYDGSNNILEVRISNNPIRPTNATMHITNIDLSSNLAGGDVYFGFSGATGLFSEKQSISRFFLRNKFNPFGSNLNNCDFKQSTVNINLLNSNDINCSNPTSVITVSSTDQLGANSSIGVSFSVDEGQATITPSSIITNAISGTASVTVSNLISEYVTIRAVSTEGALETLTIFNTGNISIYGDMTACSNSTVQLTTNDIANGTWSSSNTAIATVSNTGLVTTKNVGGTCLITYTPNGGFDCAVSGKFQVQAINLTSPTTAITYNGLNEGVNQIFVSVGSNSGTPKTYKWYRNTINSKVGATLVATHNNPLTTDIYAASSNTIGKFFYYCDVDNTYGCTTKSSDFSGVMVVNQRGLNTKGDKILYPTVNYLNADGDFLTTAGINDQGEKFTINTLPTVTTGIVSNIAPNSFSVNTTDVYDAGMNITEKGFVYSLSSNPTIADSKVVVGTGSSTFSSTISNLSQSTTYYVRPYITNIYGTFYGNQTTTTTISGYRYYKWNITALRDAATGGAVQVSEFSFQLNGVDQTWSGVNITARGDNAPALPQAEGIAQLTDGNLSTKWLDFSTSGTPISWVRFDFGNGVYKKFTSYKWHTANDETSRDPISWTIQGSNDGTNWTSLDTQSNYSVTTTRKSTVGTFTLP